ncbi:MAG: permease prefix domain 1-containing protein [Vicinamibacterales bacterium]
MTAFADAPLEDQITQWRSHVRRRHTLERADIEELESHLRDELSALMDRGLQGDEAFLVAVKRMGNLDAITREFARTHSERLWKQLVVAADDRDEGVQGSSKEPFIVLGLAVAAALATKVPALFGHHINPDEEAPAFYLRNASLFALPMLTLYFIWKRGWNALNALWFALPFLAAAVLVNVYPWTASPVGGSPRVPDTEVLTTLHLPIALWLVIGIAYVRDRWRSDTGRMDFVRFSGELAIYYVLIALGGFVFILFTFMMFRAIELNAAWFVAGWVIPCGAAGAVIVGSWLVEAKQSVIENMAPVLTRLFTPLFTLLLLAFLATMMWTGHPIDVKREVLIGFDLLLALVMGLALYAASARAPEAPPDLFDRLQLLLVTSALVVDVVALAAMASRISEFGFTPNRVAALGENLILLVNLAGTAWFYARFVFGAGPFTRLERWQTAYLPIYAVWAAIVVAIFPPVFGYR